MSYSKAYFFVRLYITQITKNLLLTVAEGAIPFHAKCNLHESDKTLTIVYTKTHQLLLYNTYKFNKLKTIGLFQDGFFFMQAYMLIYYQQNVMHLCV